MVTEEQNPDSDTRAKILVAQSAMFSFLFDVHLNKWLFIRTDSNMLAKNLQGVKVSPAEGAEYAQTVQNQLREERNDDEYDLFWNGVLTD